MQSSSLLLNEVDDYRHSTESLYHDIWGFQPWDTVTLQTFKQLVDCPTRGNKTLDLLYARVKEASPHVTSDHILIHLLSEASTFASKPEPGQQGESFVQRIWWWGPRWPLPPALRPSALFDPPNRAEQVRRELGRPHPGKAAGADGVSSKCVPPSCVEYSSTSSTWVWRRIVCSGRHPACFLYQHTLQLRFFYINSPTNQNTTQQHHTNIKQSFILYSVSPRKDIVSLKQVAQTWVLPLTGQIANHILE